MAGTIAVDRGRGPRPGGPAGPSPTGRGGGIIDLSDREWGSGHPRAAGPRPGRVAVLSPAGEEAEVRLLIYAVGRRVLNSEGHRPGRVPGPSPAGAGAELGLLTPADGRRVFITGGHGWGGPGSSHFRCKIGASAGEAPCWQMIGMAVGSSPEKHPLLAPLALRSPGVWRPSRESGLSRREAPMLGASRKQRQCLALLGRSAEWTVRIPVERGETGAA
jgi:hypothetical protein